MKTLAHFYGVCDDGVSEDDAEFPECGTNNGGCEQICRCPYIRPVCSCLPGYTLDDRHRCLGKWQPVSWMAARLAARLAARVTQLSCSHEMALLTEGSV